MTPREEVIAKFKHCCTLAEQLYPGINMKDVQLRFDIKGRVAGWASHKRGQYLVRINPDLMVRETRDMVDDTVPHELAHIVCFKQPQRGRNHDYGWQRVCIALGGTGRRTHDNEVVYGHGKTYEYTTDRGQKVRLSERHHARVLAGETLRFRRGKGSVTRGCAYTIVGEAGRTFDQPKIPVVPNPPPVHKVIQAVQRIVPTFKTPLVVSTPAARAVMGYDKPPVPSYVPPVATQSKAETSRRLMMTMHRAGKNYEEIITAMMTACGYNRQLARATYKANAARAGVPCDY